MLVQTTSHPVRLCCSGVNPAFSAEELQYQLEATKAKFLFVHPAILQTALAAAKAVSLPNERIVLIQPPSNPNQPFATLDELISEGLRYPHQFVDRKFKPGEAKTKIAVSIRPRASFEPCRSHLSIDDSFTTRRLGPQGNPRCRSTLNRLFPLLIHFVVCCHSSLLAHCKYPPSRKDEQGVRPYCATGEEKVCSGEHFDKW